MLTSFQVYNVCFIKSMYHTCLSSYVFLIRDYVLMVFIFGRNTCYRNDFDKDETFGFICANLSYGTSPLKES